MIVVDASAVVELLLNTAAGRKLAERIRSPHISLHTPHLMDVELTQVLRRYVRIGAVSDEQALVALEHLSVLDVERYAHTSFLPRIWALKENLSAHDAAYVALAEAISAPLITGDRRLANAPGLYTEVQVLD